MSYISFDKYQLVNLEYSLNREILRSNRAGAYASTTIINCNTRKYHGLLITPQPGLDNLNHVLLSSLDETVIQQNAEFHLAIHQFPGNLFEPKGHKYLREFTADPIPKLTYRVGGVVLTKEMIFTPEDRLMIRYTLVDAHSPTRIRLKPFLAFRNIHELSKSNIFADKKYEPVENGIRICLYKGYTDLFLQLSRKNEYTHVPDWYYNIEYQKEKMRGYEYREDLYVPGFFEFDIKKEESVCFSAGISLLNTRQMTRAFNAEITKRIPRDTFENCLVNSAQQFTVKSGGKTNILAGFPWYSTSARCTFISLPGILLETGELKTAREVLETMMQSLNGCLFPSMTGNHISYHQADAPLWYFFALQQYTMHTGDLSETWKTFGSSMGQILEGFRDGNAEGIRMIDNGLISSALPGIAMTWMDARAYDKPVTPRSGLTVEINALWYNALGFYLMLAEKEDDRSVIDRWKAVFEMIPDSFISTFWDPAKRFLADYVDGAFVDWTVRPNMVLAASLPFSPVPEEIRKEVLSRVKQELLTSRGLRTLTPKCPLFKGVCSGNPSERETALYQGTIWPWLLGHFAEAYLKLHGRSGLGLIRELYSGFEQVMTEHGIGSVSEYYDGDPPHNPGGAISFAASVGELLRVRSLIKKYE